MEFVEGETLGNLIKRCRRLEPNIALEISRQVAAGLAAIHEQNLVHREYLTVSYSHDEKETECTPHSN